MIITNLKGGLGNQMFQYACGRALAVRNNDTLKVYAEGLKRANEVGDIYRPFSLAHFNINAELASEEETRSLKYKSYLWRKIQQKILRQFYVAFVPSVLKKKGDIYLDGFFQSEKYFASIEDTIREEFTLKTELGTLAKEAAEMLAMDAYAVSLHVRRGDYPSHPDFGGIADIEYYGRAVPEIKKRVPKARFYVFSDDIAWCKENLSNLIGDDAVFVSKPDMKDYEELRLMSRCKHHIIPNSTFSWWSAWLNPHTDKIVVAPSRWAHGKKEENFRDIIPNTWIRV